MWAGVDTQGVIDRQLVKRMGTPEEVAAEAFFQAKDVRSDDNRFEAQLKP